MARRDCSNTRASPHMRRRIVEIPKAEVRRFRREAVTYETERLRASLAEQVVAKQIARQERARDDGQDQRG
jgi:hypothetical protein